MQRYLDQIFHFKFCLLASLIFSVALMVSCKGKDTSPYVQPVPDGSSSVNEVSCFSGGCSCSAGNNIVMVHTTIPGHDCEDIHLERTSNPHIVELLIKTDKLAPPCKYKTRKMRASYSGFYKSDIKKVVIKRDHRSVELSIPTDFEIKGYAE